MPPQTEKSGAATALRHLSTFESSGASRCGPAMACPSVAEDAASGHRHQSGRGGGQEKARRRPIFSQVDADPPECDDGQDKAEAVRQLFCPPRPRTPPVVSPTLTPKTTRTAAVLLDAVPIQQAAAWMAEAHVPSMR